MMLKVGELAKRCGLTVRTLHHYDTLGLLIPSARSDSGYRLYNRADIARLHRIQALQRFGLSLAEIGDMLANNGVDLPALIAQQIQTLNQQIEQAAELRNRLGRLQQQLATGEEPNLADWLTTLELMNMQEKYFAPAELEQLRQLNINPLQPGEAWPGLVADVRALMQRGVPPASAEAQEVAKRWKALISPISTANPRLFAKLDAMLRNEPSQQQQTGIDNEMLAYIGHAMAQDSVDIYAKYLDAEELEHFRNNYGKRAAEWPPLISAVWKKLDEGKAPDSPEVQVLARRWIELFQDFAGTNPATHLKFRTAFQNEPGVVQEGGLNEEILGFIRQAIGHLHPQ